MNRTFFMWLSGTCIVLATTLGVAMADGLDAVTISTVLQPDFPSNTLNFAGYGIADGKTLNTAAFEKAITMLSVKGGGTLNVPPGFWLTGPIKLRSNINLHLQRGALIKFSGDYKLYPLTVIDIRGEKSMDSVSPISGDGLDNVALTGEGIIDGGGDAWRPIRKGKLSDGDWKALVKSGGMLNEKGDTWFPSREVMDGQTIVEQLGKQKSLNPADYEPVHQYFRPNMFRLIGCKQILIEGVTFQNPPAWTINPILCENVSLVNVQVRNSPIAQNSDALDLESCRHALIRDCTFDAGDDGICLKSGKDEVGRRINVPTEDVLVEGCTVYHAHGGFTIGSEMSGGVRNVTVTNCTFMGTDIGLRFKSTRGRGGVVENIHMSNVRMADISGDAINFSMSYGGKSPLEDSGASVGTNIPPVTEETPEFRDFDFENILCRGADHAIQLQGLPEMPLRDFTFKNVAISSRQGISLVDAEGITFENVQVENQSGEALKAIRVRNCKLDLLK